MRRRTDPFTIAAAVLAVLALALAGYYASAGPRLSIRTGSVHDDGPEGSGLLRRYLDAMGIRTSVIEGAGFAIEGDVRAVFVLGITERLSPDELATLRRYVETGGTLVVASDLAQFAPERQLLDVYDIRPGPALVAGIHAVGSGALAAPPVRAVAMDRGRELAIGDTQLPLATDGVAPIAALAHAGRGTVVAIGSLAPFLDGHLGEADNARLALALAWTAVANGGSVAFDEYHHGSHPSSDLLVLVERTWPGRALVYAGLVVFAFLVLTGRRFGAPIPLDPRPPRSSLEYVRSFAGLVRRARGGEFARERLRREVRAIVERAVELDSAHRAEAAAIDALLARRLRDDVLLRTVRRIETLAKEVEATPADL